MFFLANDHKNLIHNHHGLLELEKIILGASSKTQLIKFIENFTEEATEINNIQLTKSSRILRFYIMHKWSIDILHQEQILSLCEEFEHFKNAPHILTFDGFEFKLQTYNQTYLDSLIKLYLNKDIYIGIATNIDMSCYIYSSNAPGLEILVDLVRYACVILMRWNDIEDALNQRSQFHTFTFDNESGVKIIDKSHLLVFSYDYDTTYKISKTIFLDLIQTYNNHHHSSRDIFCAKTVLILDDQSAQLDLID
jgi:hypothetical protein